MLPVGLLEDWLSQTSCATLWQHALAAQWVQQMAVDAVEVIYQFVEQVWLALLHSCSLLWG